MREAYCFGSLWLKDPRLSAHPRLANLCATADDVEEPQAWNANSLQPSERQQGRQKTRGLREQQSTSSQRSSGPGFSERGAVLGT